MVAVWMSWNRPWQTNRVVVRRIGGGGGQQIVCGGVDVYATGVEINLSVVCQLFREVADGVVDILQKYPVPECDIWFIKFSCDFHYNSMAVGNREGKVYVWELQSSPPNLIARLSHPHCKHPIRQTAISHDGSTILCCCDDGSMWRWDVAQ